jgi:alpha-beta hydrolase superfamily lysophospholipase
MKNDITLVPAPKPSQVLLFAVGAGGNPARHAPLFDSLARQGCTVIAPHFERLTGPAPGADELNARADGLRRCLDRAAGMGHPLAAIGHSIGAALLLGLAGGRMWTRSGELLDTGTDRRIAKLVAITPAMDFFRAPGALDALQIPVQAWAGMKDTITPPEQTAFLENALPSRVTRDVRYIAEAGHFSFMDELPPQVSDPMQGRETFLKHFAEEVGAFLTGRR